MINDLDPSLTALVIVFAWQATKCAVFVTAAAVCLLSGKPARRAEARRILRIMAGRQSHD